MLPGLVCVYVRPLRGLFQQTLKACAGCRNTFL